MEEYTNNYYQSINKTEGSQTKKVVEIIEELYQPKSVIDIGCGTGLYLTEFKAPVRIGYDFSPEAFKENVKKDVEMVLADIRTENFPFIQKYDLCICFEMLEHIEEEFADIVVKNLTNSSDIIILTAAPEGQMGLNHVNLQPQKYWDEKFEKLGFERYYNGENLLLTKLYNIHPSLWLIRNLMVYKKI